MQRRAQQALCAAAAAALVLDGAGSASARGFDLPTCSNFQAAAGIEFCDVKRGSGESPQLGDQVEVDYTARVTETGKVHAGSRNFEFTLGQGDVIPGWEVALLGAPGLPAMQEGGIRTVRIPPELAYGEDGTGCLYGLSTSCLVPPNSSITISFVYKGLGYFD